MRLDSAGTATPKSPWVFGVRIVCSGSVDVEPRVQDASAAQREFPHAVHVAGVGLQGRLNNNRMERFNGELRDREKVTRNLKKSDTPILAGMQIFHNYIRPHMALNGRTPAELAGIRVKGENKWITIIQNAGNGESA